MGDGNGSDTQPAAAASATALEVIPATALDTITRAEIETQASTARKYRRSLHEFRSRALAMATADQETAASCSYALVRDGKTIDGPSIRLAEIVLACWGNLRAGSRLISEDDRTVTAQGLFHDLETNVCITTEVRRRITNRRGQRLSDDMVTVTGNAACAIALRNVVFKGVPLLLVEPIRLAAMKAATGTEATLEDRRAKAVAHFTALGVAPERVLAALAVYTEQAKTGVQDISLADLTVLHGFATAIKDGVATAAELFPVAGAEEDPTASRAAKIAEELKAKRATIEEPKA